MTSHTDTQPRTWAATFTHIYTPIHIKTWKENEDKNLYFSRLRLCLRIKCQ